MRRRIMAGNWKMYKTPQETEAFFARFAELMPGAGKSEVVIFPATVSLCAAVGAARSSGAQVGAQNIYWGTEGAFTGEVSADMVKAAGASWVLVGHSERRHVVSCEKDSEVLKKTQSALHAGLKPIVCMGEKLDDHKAGKVAEVLVKQFAGGVAGLTEEQFAQIALAYEPVWAIGTGKVATPEIASESHRLIREEVEKRFGAEAAQQVRILYGGSVKPENIEGLMREPELDGVLVGGASLDAQSFFEIVCAG